MSAKKSDWPFYRDYIEDCSENFIHHIFQLMDLAKKYPLIDRQFVLEVDDEYVLKLSKTHINLVHAADMKVTCWEKRGDMKALPNLLAKYLKIKIDEWNAKEE